MFKKLIALLLICSSIVADASATRCPDVVHVCSEVLRQCEPLKADHAALSEFVAECRKAGEQRAEHGCLYAVVIQASGLRIECGPAEQSR